MLRTGSAVTALLVCLPSIASAESLAHPGQVAVAGHATLVLPQADADRVSGTSPGVRFVATYWFTPHVAAIGSFDYVLVNEKTRAVGPETTLSFYAINVGARFALKPESGVLPIGEVLIGRHTASVRGPQFSDTSSDLGFRVGAGALIPLGGDLGLTAQLSYSLSEIEGSDIDAFMLEIGLGWNL